MGGGLVFQYGTDRSGSLVATGAGTRPRRRNRKIFENPVISAHSRRIGREASPRQERAPGRADATGRFLKTPSFPLISVHSKGGRGSRLVNFRGGRHPEEVSIALGFCAARHKGPTSAGAGRILNPVISGHIRPFQLCGLGRQGRWTGNIGEAFRQFHRNSASYKGVRAKCFVNTMKSVQRPNARRERWSLLLPSSCYHPPEIIVLLPSYGKRCEAGKGQMSSSRLASRSQNRREAQNGNARTMCVGYSRVCICSF